MLKKREHEHICVCITNKKSAPFATFQLSSQVDRYKKHTWEIWSVPARLKTEVKPRCSSASSLLSFQGAPKLAMKTTGFLAFVLWSLDCWLGAEK